MARICPVLLATTLLLPALAAPPVPAQAQAQAQAPTQADAPLGAPTPVHTLLATLAGDYTDLPEQDDPHFGFAVALHGDTLAVGAPGTRVASAVPTFTDDRGAVFVFRLDPASNTWLLDQRFDYPSLSAARCGHSVALNDNTLLVGCPMQGPGGRVVFHTRAHSNAPFTGMLILDDESVQGGARCGTSVALIDSAPGTNSILPMAAVGCPERRDFPVNVLGLVGGVDIYRDFLGWQLATALNGPALTASGFGQSVSLNRAGPSPGMTLLLAVGIPGQGFSTGSVRVFAMGNTVAEWTQEHQLIGPHNGSRFGYSVHMRAGRLAIGAPERPILVQLEQESTGSLSIATRVCTFQGNCSWSANVTEALPYPLPASPTAVKQMRLGHAVHALTPSRILAGAPLYPFTQETGQARHYRLLGDTWVLNTAEPFIPLGAAAPATAYFGHSVSGDDTWLAIGAPVYPEPTGQAGRVFVYAWDFDDTIFANDFECIGPEPGCI